MNIEFMEEEFSSWSLACTFCTASITGHLFLALVTWHLQCEPEGTLSNAISIKILFVFFHRNCIFSRSFKNVVYSSYLSPHIFYLISLAKIQQKPFAWELIGDEYKTDVNMKNWSQLEGRQNEFTLKRDKEGGERRWHRYRTQVCWRYEAACLCHWRVCKDPRWTCAVGTSCKRLMSLCVRVCECVCGDLEIENERKEDRTTYEIRVLSAQPETAEGWRLHLINSFLWLENGALPSNTTLARTLGRDPRITSVAYVWRRQSYIL